MAERKKPTGTIGSLTLRGQGLPPLFMPIAFPTSKEAIEEFIVEGATATAAKAGLRLFGQTSRVIRNPENDFDYTIPTKSGEQYLDLMEIAPLSYIGGSYENGPGSYQQGDMADWVWSEVQRKASKYGPARIPIHLLVYPTDWRFRISVGTIRLIALQLIKEKHPFASVVYYAPDDARTGDLKIVHPIPLKPGEVAAFDEAKARRVMIMRADLRTFAAAPDGKSATLKLSPPPKKRPS